MTNIKVIRYLDCTSGYHSLLVLSLAVVIAAIPCFYIHNSMYASSLLLCIILYLIFVKHTLSRKTNYDSLTGLNSRDFFLKQTDKLIKAKKNFCLLLMDLDRFKQVNDTLGHTVGDELLKLAAMRLQSTVRKKRPGDSIARLGGDEFAILLETSINDVHIKNICTRIAKEFQKPFKIGRVETTIGVSIGVSKFPDNGETAIDILRCADVSMYNAKNSKTSFFIYDQASDLNTLEVLNISNALHKALEASELFLLYQPKKNLKDKKIIGVEALLRWKHPVLGVLPPNQFIHIAEQTGLLYKFTPFLIGQVINDIKYWTEQGINLQVSINLSTTCLDMYSVTLLKDLLHENNIEPNKITIEITETEFREPEILDTLTVLSELGCQISIDDFGTGHSTMLYLKEMPVNEIKIDKTFIEKLPTDVQNLKIVTSVIKLAHEINCLVVAEGVEDVETLETLKKLECDIIQGYYLSKPIAAAKITSNFISTLEMVN